MTDTFHSRNPALQDSILVFNQDCELVSQLPINIFKKCKVRLWTKVFSLCRYRPQSSFAQSKTSKKMILLHNIVSHLLSKAIYNIHCNLPVCLFQICLNISAAFWISYISFWNKCLILCRSIAPFTNLFSLQKCWF